MSFLYGIAPEDGRPLLGSRFWQKDCIVNAFPVAEHTRYLGVCNSSRFRRQAMKRAIFATAGTAILCAAAMAQQAGMSDQYQSAQQSGQPGRQMQSEAGAGIKGFVADIEKLTDDNSNFRRVLYTGKHLQLVLMTLKPGEEIGEEVHNGTDQFFRIEEGKGEVRINGEPTKINSGDAVLVPAGARHNVINTGGEPLRLYTLYAPPQHRDGTVQATKADAEKAKEHFDGKTTEPK